MNAGTAITLGSENLFIVPGQLITGPKITTNIYVSSINGTALVTSANVLVDATPNVLVDATREVRHVVDEKHETEEGKLGLFGRINLFYRQVVAELRKVVWPTQKQLTTYTAVVFVFVGFIIAVVSILDVALTKIVFWIFG